MIVYMLGTVMRVVFEYVVGAMRLLFGDAWGFLATRVTGILALEGVQAGIALFDTFVGVSFVSWATGFAVLIIVTLRLVRLVMGLFSKG
jgi:hypothetical protein